VAKIGERKKGYVVSSPRVPKGRYFRTLREAKRELNRQLRYSSESGIREVFEDEWALAKLNKRTYKFVKGKLKKVM